jgi:hypothetical protein
VHPHAQLATEAAEAAAGQGKFWPMHNQLLDHQDALTAKDLIRYAGEAGLDTERFTRDLRNDAGQAKIAADVDSTDLSGVSGTPTFFHQRQTPPRRLRHQHPLRRGTHRQDTDPDQLGLQPSGVVGVGEAGDPFGGGGKPRRGQCLRAADKNQTNYLSAST